MEIGKMRREPFETMNKTRRGVRLPALIAALAMAAAAGCSSEPSPGSGAGTDAAGAAPAPSEKTVEISYWRHDHAVAAASLNKQIEAFEKAHPHIKVKMQLIPYGEYETKIRTSLAAGTPPDILGIDAPMVASYAKQGALLPLDNYMKADGNVEDIVAPVLKSLTYNNQIYAAPLNDASIALFYNKKIFEQKGVPLPSKRVDEAWTWEQMLEAAKKIHDPANQIIAIDPAWGLKTDEGATFTKLPFIWQAGGDILSPDASTAKGYLDSPATLEAIRFFNSLYNVEKVAVKELPPEAFETGKLAMTVNVPAYIETITKKYPNFKLGEDWEVAPLWKGKKQVTPNGSWNMGIAAKSKHPDEAWKFVNWITGVDGAKVWYQDTKNLPARYSTAEAFPELNQYPFNIFVEQSAKYAVPRPVTEAYPTISSIVSTMFQEVVLAGKTPEEAANKAIVGIEEAIARNKK